MPEFFQAAFNTFIGGLVTEAGPLTFPENASVDELNCDLLRNGARRRRLGIQFESNHVLSTLTVLPDTVVTVHSWQDVAEQEGTQFAVVQVGRYISFYEFTGEALSAGIVKESFTSSVDYLVDLADFARPATLGVETAAIEVASVKGALIVASPEVNTFIVTRDVETGAFTAKEINFRIRDFRWLGDRSTYSDRTTPENTPMERRYDTLNAGWGTTSSSEQKALDIYLSDTNKWPALTHPWFSGLDEKGDFRSSRWRRIPSGNSLLGNGKYIFSLYSQDRNSVDSKISGLETTVETARFSAVASYSGRVFFSGMQNSTQDNGNRVYFSQLLVYGLDEVGELMQVNDPTSRDFSDLLDTDGGFISIPEAHQIRKLHVFGPNLLVFASNGVWAIGGVDDVFRATEFTVTKLGEDGLLSQGSFVSAQGRPYWWSNTGIFTIQAGELGNLQAQNLSIGSIQTFFDKINANAKDSVRGVYDTSRRRIMWMYPDNDETNRNKKNNILLLDEELPAFFPWRIEDQSSNTDYLVDGIFFQGTVIGSILYNVVDSNGDQVVDSLGNEVVVNRTDRSLESSSVFFLSVDGDTGSLTFAQFRNIEFEDWEETPFVSFAETGYTFAGDMLTLKSLPYITVYLKTTETGFTFDEETGGYLPIRPSSLRVASVWDFRFGPHSAYQQAYRLKYPVVVDTGDLDKFDYPQNVVTTRLKLRGRGRSMRIRFESEPNKDFYLLGFEILVAKPGKF